MIGRIENISGDNRLVMIPLTVLRSIIVVLLCLVCKEVWCEGLIDDLTATYHVARFMFCYIAGSKMG